MPVSQHARTLLSHTHDVLHFNMSAVKCVYFSPKIQSQQSAKYRSSAANFVLCTPDSTDGCNMEPTGKAPLETLWKRADTFKSILGVCLGDLFITVYQETLTITGKMMARKVDFKIQRTAKQTIWTRVKRWTRLKGTWRRKEKSGWCLAGIRYNLIRSQNWNRGIQNVFSGVQSLQMSII